MTSAGYHSDFSSKKKAGAFTLLELLVAMAVLAVLLAILLSIVSGASTLWRESESRVDSFREARAALNLVTADLASLYASSDPKFISVATKDADIGKLVKTAADDEIGSALFFITALPEAAQDPDLNESDLCAVGYFVAFNKASASINAKNSYNLYRYFISSNETFENIVGDEPTPFFAGTGPKVSATIKEVEIVARNITRFQVEPYTLEADASGAFTKLSDFVQSDTSPVPDVLDVTIVAVNQDTADRWDGTKSDWEDENSTTYEQNARTFTARVYLHGARLANEVAARPTPTPTPTPAP